MGLVRSKKSLLMVTNRLQRMIILVPQRGIYTCRLRDKGPSTRPWELEKEEYFNWRDQDEKNTQDDRLGPTSQKAASSMPDT